MSRVRVLHSVRFILTWFEIKVCRRVTWAALTVTVNDAQVTPGLLSHSVYSDKLLLLSSPTRIVVKPHFQATSHAPSKCSPARPCACVHACLRTPEYAIERIIHHYGVSEVVSSSCLFPTISYFHTGDSHLAFLQDRLIFSGSTHSVVSAQ